MQAEFADAEREQQWGEHRVAGDLAAHRHRLAAPRWRCGSRRGAPAAPPGAAANTVRPGLVGAVGGQQVLHQVVGADRQEIAQADEAGSEIAADGTSIIAPSGTWSATSKPSLRNSSNTASSARRTVRISSYPLTIGTSARKGP
jgi:hypothetical protein